jgi:hypothetical protein
MRNEGGNYRCEKMKEEKEGRRKEKERGERGKGKNE